MAYVPNFEYDIFISYAHVDNLTTPTESEGWISTFQKCLAVLLSQRVGKMGTIKIWRDPSLDGSQLFDTTIQNRINQSALFLAFTSTGYLSSDYCRQELEWFHKNAATNNLGINVGDRMRVLNVLLNNIPHPEWPDYFGKTSGYPFFDTENEEDGLGYPLKNGGEVFEKQLRKLVDAIYKTLIAIKDVLTPAAAPRTFTKTIYLADTADSLVRYRKRLLNDLGNNVRIVSNVPPPYDAESHQEKVVEAMKMADLSVHLLDDLPGREIQGDEGKSYPQKQVELGLEHAKSQFIWVPNTLDPETIEDQCYKNFINELQSGNRGAANYCFIKGSASSISREVTEMLERTQVPSQNGDSASAAALLDTHLKDQRHAFRLGEFLMDKCITPYVTPEEDDPKKNMKVLEERLKQVNKLIVIYGDVAEDWVQERLRVAMHLAIDTRVDLKAFGVYFAPPRQRGPEGIFKLPWTTVHEFDNRDISNPQNLGPMLNPA
jgi:hypothetical protein